MQEIIHTGRIGQPNVALKETIELYLAGLTYEEIARELAVPVTTVKNRLSFAKGHSLLPSTKDNS